MFKRVRAGRPSGPIPFRCDSPQERRFLELLIAPLPDGHIDITSTIIKTENRSPVRLLDKDTQRTKELLRICSMCKKMATPQNEWIEIEEGLARLKIFEVGAMPRLTHGVCPRCYRVALAELNATEPS